MSVETRVFAPCDGPALAYDSAGSGAVVLFLHGIGGNRTNWREQLPAFAAAGYHAVAWDARGYGDSQDYDGPLEFPDFSNDLARLLDHLQVRQAHLVGLSMGGRIIQHFHSCHHDRIASMTLCATMPGFEGTMSPARKAEFVRLRKQPLLEGKTPEEMAPAVARSLLGPCTTARHHERLVASMAALHAESYIKTIEATVMFEHQMDLAAITCPTLLVFGESDTLARAMTGRRMHAAVPGSEFRLFRQTGHLINIERPDAFNRVVLEFLERRGGSGSATGMARDERRDRGPENVVRRKRNGVR